MKTMSSLMFAPAVLAAVLAAVIAPPAAAQEQNYAVTVHRAQLHPATPAAARRTIARIEAAALEACGASSSSLRELKLAVRDSACWHETMAGTMERIDDPLLLGAYHHRP